MSRPSRGKRVVLGEAEDNNGKGVIICRKRKAFCEKLFAVLGVAREPFAGNSPHEIELENNPVDLALRVAALFLEDKKAAHRLAQSPDCVDDSTQREVTPETRIELIARLRSSVREFRRERVASSE